MEREGPGPTRGEASGGPCIPCATFARSVRVLVGVVLARPCVASWLSPGLVGLPAFRQAGAGRLNAG